MREAVLYSSYNRKEGTQIEASVGMKIEALGIFVVEGQSVQQYIGLDFEVLFFLGGTYNSTNLAHFLRHKLLVFEWYK
jgi:hypothetical protein